MSDKELKIKISADTTSAVAGIKSIVGEFATLKKQQVELKDSLSKATEKVEVAARALEKSPKDTGLAASYEQAIQEARKLSAQLISVDAAAAATRQKLKSVGVDSSNINQSIKQIQSLKEAVNQLKQAELQRKTSAAQMKAAGIAPGQIAQVNQLTDATNKLGLSTKQTSLALRQVPMQFSDIVVSLQAGQSPMQVFLQQGLQLKDLFGGSGAAASALGRYVLGLVNPYTLAAAAAAGLATAYYYGSEQSTRLNTALITSGNVAGGTVGSFNAMAKEVGDATGRIGEAREAMEALASSGVISSTRIKTALDGIVAGTILTKKNVGDLVKEYESIAKSPLKALLELNETQNFLTLSVYKQIDALEKQGKQQQAVDLAMQTYSNTVQSRASEVVQSLGYIERAWNAVKAASAGALAGALDKAASVGRPDTIADELASAEEALRKQQSQNKEVKKLFGKYTPSFYDDAEADLQNKVYSLQTDIAKAEARTQSKAQRAKDQTNKVNAQGALNQYLNSDNRFNDKDLLSKKIREEEDEFKRVTQYLDKNSAEFKSATNRRDQAITNLKEAAEKKEKKPPKVKGLVNPITQAFNISKDDIAQLRQSLDQVTADVKDRLAEAATIYNDAYKDNQISLSDYYAARVAITEKGASEEIEAQEKLLAALNAERNKAQALPQKTERDRENKRNRIADVDRQIQDANNKILVIERERGQAVATIARERGRDLKTLQDQMAELALQNAIASGTDTAEARAEAIRRQNADLLAQAKNNEAQLPGITQTITRNIEIQINQDALSRAESEFNAALQRMSTAEQSIHIQQEAGLLTEQQAREQIIALHKQTAQELQKILPLLEQAANAIGPDAVAKIQAWKNAIAQTEQSVDDIAVRLEGEFKNSMANFFSDITDGAHSASDAILNFASSFVKAMAQIASQRAATAIFDSLFGKAGGTNAPASSGGGSSGAALSSIFGSLFVGGGSGGGEAFSGFAGFLSSYFHDGGVVGAKTGVKKTVPTIAFNGAPRYHSGGIAGLKPNEVPAVLMGGPKGLREEVLTADDPRHSDNLTKSGGYQPQQPAYQPQQVNIVNALDANDVANAVFGTSGFSKAIVNAIRMERGAVKILLG